MGNWVYFSRVSQPAIDGHMKACTNIKSSPV